MKIAISPTEEERNLLALLQSKGVKVSAPCGGCGHCGRCKVLLDGKPVLACQTEIEKEVVVEVPEGSIRTGTMETTGRMEGRDGVFAVDIGTTTVAVCLTERGKAVDVITFDNPQLPYGADVLSRIKSAKEKGVESLRRPLLKEIKRAMDELCGKYGCISKRVYVCGNTTMLHIFWGEDVSTLGVYPYTPVFLSERKGTIAEMECEVISLPGISAYVGADIVAGISVCPKPSKGKILYVDLGTNAEIALVGDDITVTSAAAGPCFEAGNISCGMPATDGAITSFSLDGERSVSYLGTRPVGLCGTGLIDVIGQLVKHNIIDKTGYLIRENGYPIANNVILTQKDVREFQTAKSAVRSAIEVLLSERKTAHEEIEKVYLSGGFSTMINTESVIQCGLLPAAFTGKIVAIGNGALAGTVAFSSDEKSCAQIARAARYVDLGGRPEFSAAFIKNIDFIGG